MLEDDLGGAGKCSIHSSGSVRPVVAQYPLKMRRGEILNLTWDNVDLRNGYLLVTQSKNGDRREVPINGAVREVLGGIVRRLDSMYVFCDEKGRMYKGGRNALERACKRAGIYNYHFRDLRHTAASFMAMGAVDLMAIKQILGHKTIQMTLRYSHLSPGHLRNAVAAIDRALTSLSDQLHNSLHSRPKAASPPVPQQV